MSWWNDNDRFSQRIAKWISIAQEPLDNALVLSDNLCEYLHKWYIAKTRFFGGTVMSQKVEVYIQPLLRNGSK